MTIDSPYLPPDELARATPKPRAGEHANPMDAVNKLIAMQTADIRAERDLLRERERELVEALASIDQLMMAMPLTSKIEHQVHGIAHRALAKVRP